MLTLAESRNPPCGLLLSPVSYRERRAHAASSTCAESQAAWPAIAPCSFAPLSPTCCRACPATSASRSQAHPVSSAPHTLALRLQACSRVCTVTAECPMLVNRQRIPTGGAVLDLMSSWVSHLPSEASYSRVVGHGMNAAELAKNRQLDTFFVRNLNTEPDGWALEDQSMDAVTCCVRHAPSLHFVPFFWKYDLVTSPNNK